LENVRNLFISTEPLLSAQKEWRKLDGQNRLPEIIQRGEFRDGSRQLQTAA
jgi:hypothetical protein